MLMFRNPNKHVFRYSVCKITQEVSMLRMFTQPSTPILSHMECCYDTGGWNGHWQNYTLSDWTFVVVKIKRWNPYWPYSLCH